MLNRAYFSLISVALLAAASRHAFDKLGGFSPRRLRCETAMLVALLPAWVLRAWALCAVLCCAVGWAGLGWAGLGWAGLGWAGLGWAGLGWAGLPCACQHERGRVWSLAAAHTRH
jgi:hypothetical protein